MFGFFENYGLYPLFSLPALLLGLWTQFKVQSSFGKCSRVRTGSGMTGAQIARRILDLSGLRQVAVEQLSGFLSDHYDPHSKVLRLSPEGYQSSSVAARSVAAHEAGHALQDQQGYFALRLRTAIVPTVQIGSWLGPVLFMVGLLTVSAFGTTLAWLGLLLFAATTALAIITLPVEFDASRRAKELLVARGLVTAHELGAVNSVLIAAALTYVAAAVQAVSALLYHAFLLTGLRRQEEQSDSALPSLMRRE